MGASTANVTITAPIGAGEAAVAAVLNGVQAVDFDVESEMVNVKLSDGRTIGYAYDTVATVTWVIASKVATVTIST